MHRYELQWFHCLCDRLRTAISEAELPNINADAGWGDSGGDTDDDEAAAPAVANAGEEAGIDGTRDGDAYTSSDSGFEFA